MKRLALSFAAIAMALPAYAGTLEELGREIAELNCAGCHAVGLDGTSAHREAPPFRELSRRYPLDALEEAFAEGIYTGHPDMPAFEASPEQIDALLAYLETIQVPKR